MGNQPCCQAKETIPVEVTTAGSEKADKPSKGKPDKEEEVEAAGSAAASDAASDAEPEAAPEAVKEAVKEAKPEPAKKAAPEPVKEAAPEPVKEAVPEPVKEAPINENDLAMNPDAYAVELDKLAPELKILEMQEEVAIIVLSADDIEMEKAMTKEEIKDRNDQITKGNKDIEKANKEIREANKKRAEANKQIEVERKKAEKEVLAAETKGTKKLLKETEEDEKEMAAIEAKLKAKREAEDAARVIVAPNAKEHTLMEELEKNLAAKGISQKDDPASTVKASGELRVVFVDLHEKEKTVIFTHRPLGFRFGNFDSYSPLVVTWVEENGHADELGVKMRWKLKEVAGKAINSFGIRYNIDGQTVSDQYQGDAYAVRMAVAFLDRLDDNLRKSPDGQDQVKMDIMKKGHMDACHGKQLMCKMDHLDNWGFESLINTFRVCVRYLPAQKPKTPEEIEASKKQRAEASKVEKEQRKKDHKANKAQQQEKDRKAQRQAEKDAVASKVQEQKAKEKEARDKANAANQENKKLEKEAKKAAEQAEKEKEKKVKEEKRARHERDAAKNA